MLSGTNHKGALSMSYEERLAEAKKNGGTHEVTSMIHSWDEIGQYIVGEIEDISDFTGGKYDAKVKQYTIRTDKGRITTILGSFTDKQLADIVFVGVILCITYQGQKTLEDSRSINLFSVEILEKAEK
jgi:hypothetical protein